MKPNLKIIRKAMHNGKFDIYFEEVLLKLGRQTAHLCIEFDKYIDPEGYGYLQFRLNKKKYNIRAHRASFMLYNDVQLKEDEVIMHYCDNRKCINPLHLRKGTHALNVQDRVKKGRSATGKKNGRYIHGKNCK